jgi:hypothetical protein
MGLRRIFATSVLLVGVSAPALALQATAVEGTWADLAHGGNCGEHAYFRSGELSMTSNGETAVKVTITNAGTAVEGLLVIEGARRGQVVSSMTNMAMFLVDTPGGKVRVIPMALNYRSWPEAILELCPGTRPGVRP